MNIAIIIPTLNRYEHLKRCISSLACNPRAKEVDLILSLDYPPHPKYEEGYRKIKRDFKNVSGFRKYVFIENENNLGPEGNEQKLKKYVFDHNYDAFIFSEDDNEFSLNYLDYMIQGLELTKESDVEFVSGYTHLDMNIDSNYQHNYFKSKAFSAWGYGVLLKNHIRYDKYRDFELLKHLLKDRKICRKLDKEKPGSVNSIMGMIKKREFIGDTLHSIYMILEDRYCLFPTVSKVKNYGSDGTGVHSKKVNQTQLDGFLAQSIDQESSFCYSGNSTICIAVFNRNLKSGIPHTFRSLIKNAIFKFDLFLFNFTGITINSKYI